VETLASSVAYLPFGPLQSLTYGNGLSLTRTYDANYWLAQTQVTASGVTRLDLSFGRNADGQLTGVTDNASSGRGASFGYTDAGRLNAATGPWGADAYTYDAAGNRTGIGTRAQTFDARNRLLSATDTGGTTWSWTARGTLAATSGAVARTATYDAFGQAASDGSATTATGYTYDALGRQLSAAPIGSGNGPANTFRYGGLGNEPASDSATTYSYGPSGGVIAAKNGTVSALMLTDQHQDVVGGFTATGSALTASVAYDPFGKTTARGGTMPGARCPWLSVRLDRPVDRPGQHVVAQLRPEHLRVQFAGLRRQLAHPRLRGRKQVRLPVRQPPRRDRPHRPTGLRDFQKGLRHRNRHGERRRIRYQGRLGLAVRPLLWDTGRRHGYGPDPQVRG
jgi:hypothetical protein